MDGLLYRGPAMVGTQRFGAGAAQAQAAARPARVQLLPSLSHIRDCSSLLASRTTYSLIYS